MKEQLLKSINNSAFIESSSFKQIIRGVQSIINDQEDHIVSNFQPVDIQIPLTTNLQPGMTNGEKLNLLMKNIETRERATQYMKQNRYFQTFPILKVYIRGNNNFDTEFQLQQEDLFDVFSRFQNLEKVITNQAGTYIFYSDYHSAYFAEKSLNQLNLKSIQANLFVNWCQPSQYVYINQYLNYQRINSLPELARNNSSNNAKYTCRYEIQIQNERQFQVARKIIGPKGYNMKKIIDNCLNEIGADPKTEADSIKLRLRGKGSGYRQGPNKLQSQQPLHLCISCKEQNAYTSTCQLVQQLLKGIYQQYKYFCNNKQNKKVEELSIKKLDFNMYQQNCQLQKQSLYNFDTNSNVMNNSYSYEKISENQIKMYIEARNKARRELNFAEADRIRNYLKSKGVALIDEKGGRGRGVQVTTWRCNNH